MLGKKSSKTTSSGAGARSARAAPARSVDRDALHHMFDQYVTEEEPDAMTMDGISKLCEQLGLDPSADVRVLAMMWKLGAKAKPGQLQRDEFVEGMERLGAQDLAGLRNALPQFDPGFLDRNDFREFYKFVFQFSREGTHKTIEKEMIMALLPIVLDEHRAPHLSRFLQFLETSSATVITLDQWDSFLQFNYTVPLDLQGLEDDGAWPLLLDDYVEWLRQQSGK